VMRLGWPPPADQASWSATKARCARSRIRWSFGRSSSPASAAAARCVCLDVVGSRDAAKSMVSLASEAGRPLASLAPAKACSRAFNAAPRTHAGSSPLTNPAREAAVRPSRLASQKAYTAARVGKSWTQCRTTVTNSAAMP
jgi:hypothetical protein